MIIKKNLRKAVPIGMVVLFLLSLLSWATFDFITEGLGIVFKGYGIEDKLTQLGILIAIIFAILMMLGVGFNRILNKIIK